MTEETKVQKSTPQKRAGFNDKGKAYPGVDPNTGERKAITFDGLKAEFGAEEGERIYWEIAEAGQFINRSHPFSALPDLNIMYLKGDAKAQVEKSLASANLSLTEKTIKE
jgi:hypothetical protein